MKVPRLGVRRAAAATVADAAAAVTSVLQLLLTTYTSTSDPFPMFTLNYAKAQLCVSRVDLYHVYVISDDETASTSC